jgi:hypothetical protein
LGARLHRVGQFAQMRDLASDRVRAVTSPAASMQQPAGRMPSERPQESFERVEIRL